MDKALLEDFCQQEDDLEIFGMMESQFLEGNTAVFELQTKVQWLEKRLKAVPVTQTLKDLRRLGSSVAALTNKIGSEGPDMAPRTVMDHLECLFTHVKEVETKVSVTPRSRGGFQHTD